MPFFKGLGADAGVRDALRMNKAAGKALVAYHTAVLRQPSALSDGERELIAAYVSGLNACRYCHGVHAATAHAFGVDEDVLDRMLDDLEAAGVEPKLKPIFAYARKLTEAPAKLTQADADAVFAAGWDEQALHDAINVVCLFNFMNRLVEGHGIEGHTQLYAERGDALHKRGYGPILEMLEAGEDG